jgi:hypothetical protein
VGIDPAHALKISDTIRNVSMQDFRITYHYNAKQPARLGKSGLEGEPENK